MKEEINFFNKILSDFKVGASCVHIHRHRHFVFYDLALTHGYRLNKLKGISQEISLALRTRSVPAIKAIPEKGIVRLQMIFRESDSLAFDDLYQKPTSKGDFPFLIGETDEGEKMWMDMGANPHLLVAGTTGSGKSVFLHNIIANASKFEDVNVYLIDTKRVEFEVYDNRAMKDFIPLICKDYSSAVSLLQYLYDVMENRYELLRTMQLQNANQNGLSKVLLVIDELADLMLMDRSGEFERLLNLLAAKCRAAGIYIVAATQRPSVDVITGTIKANFSGRLSCKVASKTDSQVILGQPGAENLMGKGDAIFKNAVKDYTRLQVAFADPKKIVSSYALGF